MKKQKKQKKQRKQMKIFRKTILCTLLCMIVLLTGCTDAVKNISVDLTKDQTDTDGTNQEMQADSSTDTKLLKGAGMEDDPYIVVNDNTPAFTEEEITTESFEQYSQLDELGRCGAALACVGTDLMPMEKRGNISRVKPTGWHSTRYDFVEGKNLYNRCHLIAYQLSGENANEKNLITGTRFMNVSGMLPFEEQVGDYVRETGNHVMYRVTPVFEEDNLIADGVQMEAWSVEDNGKGVSYNVYVFNIQPGVEIDYATGESKEAEQKDTSEKADEIHYILNTNTKKFHLPDCSSAQKIQAENKESFVGDRQQLMDNGYEPCKSCQP